MPEKLAAYRAKRDFANTTEPRGDAGSAQTTRPRFVVQKHAATRLHYDFRLELDGVFKSWAVTRGPSLDPTVKRLAVEVEDHPIDYGDFEGTIPKGQYGGGAVQVWDRGYWHANDPEKGLKKGELKLELEGERLRGSWVLVRMKRDRSRGKHPNWLLIKHRDAYARAGDDHALLAKDRSVASGRSMRDIAVGKGRAPTPFIAREGGKADAVWQSDRSGRDKPKRARRSAPAPDARVIGVAISKPAKILWPDAGDGEPVTKLDLAHYYESVAPWMIEHLRGRPCSILRLPDGIDGERFFQRHALKGMSDRLNEVSVPGDRKTYLQIDRPEGLAAVAQLAALEVHPWNCAPGLPDVPGRLVFDLDPGPRVPFDAVVDAAHEVRDRLERVGLVAFCKTTGGKGLHVVTPVAVSGKAVATWPEAKAFAQEVCRRMAADSPASYVLTMAKTKRRGRIFLDYLRNDRMATAVAPLSSRARAGAAVSMPFDWSRVRHGLDPATFTVRTAASSLRSAKPWAEYAEAARSLRSAIGRLAKRSSS